MAAGRGDGEPLAIGHARPPVCCVPEPAFGLLSERTPLWNAPRNQPRRRRRPAPLRNSGAHFLPGISSARNRSWREPSW